MMETVVVKTEETKIFTCLIKCLIAGYLWTKIIFYFCLSLTGDIPSFKLLPCCSVLVAFWVFFSV